MTNSRLTSIIALIAAILSALSGMADLLPPKYAATITAIGAVVASLNERVNGGSSKPDKVEAVQRQLADKRMKAALKKREKGQR